MDNNAGFIINQTEIIIKNGKVGNIGNGEIYFNKDMHDDIMQSLKLELFRLYQHKGILYKYRKSTIKNVLCNIIRLIILNNRRFNLSIINDNNIIKIKKLVKISLKIFCILGKLMVFSILQNTISTSVFVGITCWA